MKLSTGPGRVAMKDVLVCATAAVVGVLVSLIQRLTHRGPLQVNKSGFPEWIKVYDRAARFISAWPWSLLLATLLIFMLILLRFRRGAWAIAFGLGAIMGTIASNALS